MEYVKVKDVKSPERGTEKSAGIDFFVPNSFPGTHWLAPGQDINIESGIHVKLPEGCALIAFNKSGQATKKHLQVGACVVDGDYQGEMHLHVTNIGTEVVSIEPGEKIIQCIILLVGHHILEELDTLKDLYGSEVSERGISGFGSTGSGINTCIHKKGDKFMFRYPYEAEPVEVEVKDDFMGDPKDFIHILKKVK